MEQRQVLAERRAEAADRLAALRRDHRDVVESTHSASTDDEHDPDGSTIAFERAQLDALIADTENRIAELDDAVGRIDSGAYGVCTSCGSAIPPARLEARPAATTCVSCAGSSSRR